MIGPTSILSIESWILIGSALVLIRYYIHRKWQYLAKLGIPHDPPSLLYFGNMRDAFSQKMFTRDLENKRKYGLVYGAYAGLNPIIIVQDLEILRKIYTKEFSSFTERQQLLTKMLGKDMNHGLTVVKGKTWKRIRSALSPTFSISKLKQMVTIMDSCTDQTIAVLQRKCGGNKGVFVAKSLFSNLSLDVIASTALGATTDSQSLDGKNTELAVQLKKIFKAGFTSTTAFICFVFPPSEWIFEKLDISLFPSSALKFLRTFTHSMIKMREESPQKQTDLLQLMLDAEVPEKQINKDSERGITRREVIGNAMLMIGAGFENTANSMVFFAFNLASHPDVQTRLQKEIDDTYKEKGKFSYETINSMKYMEMCLNESIRLYSPLLLNSRICNREVTINGLTLPKGVTVNIPTFALSRDPDYWDDPLEYNPERMADMSQIDPMVYQPFGAGPRNCIGLRFALTEIKLTFCKILQNFTLQTTENTPKPPLELVFGLGVRPAVEFSLRAVPRKDVSEKA